MTEKRADTAESFLGSPFPAGLPLPMDKARAEYPTVNLILLLVVTVAVITAYIANTITVDGVVSDLSQAEKQEKALLHERETLRAEINLLTSYHRIQSIARTNLGLVFSNQQPFYLNETLPPPTTETPTR